MDTVGNELQQRLLQERGMPVAAAFKKVLFDVCQSIEVHLPQQLTLYHKDIDLSKLTVQLKMLPDLIRAYNTSQPDQGLKLTQVATSRTLANVRYTMPSSKIMFNDVVRLLQLVLIIPVTTATAERMFSAFHRLKTFLRTGMLQPRLNHCMLLHIHKDRTDQYIFQQ